MDESGFEASTQREYVYARWSWLVMGDRNGQKRSRTHLLAARLHKCLVAPFLFPVTRNTVFVNMWLESDLCPLLNETTGAILANAAFQVSAQSGVD